VRTEERTHPVGGFRLLADEEVIGRQPHHFVGERPRPLDDRLPVGRVVALAVDHLHRTLDSVERGHDVAVVGHLRGRCERRQDVRRRPLVIRNGSQQRHRAAEAEPEQADLVVALGGPGERVPDVGPLAAPLVPGAVVEPQAVDPLAGDGVADPLQAAVVSVPAHLGVWRAGDDDRLGLGGSGVGTVERCTDVTGPGNPDGFGHTYVNGCKNFKFRGFVRGSMGILSRASYVIRSKVNALLNRAEEPGQTLDYSYEQLRDELQNVKQGIADLTTQKKRLEIQKRRLEENVERHNEQARQAVEQDRDDLARRALEKKKQKMNQIEDLESQIADLERKQDNLIKQKDDLQRQIEEFRTRKETMKARYEAAEASARVNEAMTGAGDQMEDIARTIERAEERTEEMEARSAALDELRESGALDNAVSNKSDLDRELEDLSTDASVDRELDTLKSEMDKGEEADTKAGEDLEADLETDPAEDVNLEDLEEEVSKSEVDAELEELKEEE